MPILLYIKNGKVIAKEAGLVSVKTIKENVKTFFKN